MTQNELEFLRDGLLLKCEQILREIVDNDTHKRQCEEKQKTKKEKSE